MSVSLYELCSELQNYFCDDKRIGTFKISGGQIDSLDLFERQHFRIIGSKYNDGVYQYPCYGLIDEEFNGAVWIMNIPKDVLKLKEDIDKYEENTVNAPFTSESFGGYSYTKAVDSKGRPITWRAVFCDRLNRWRKI